MSLLHASRLATLSASLVLGLSLAGCSSDGPPDKVSSQIRADASDAPGTALQMRTSIARVHGRLSPARRQQLERDAGRLLADYLAAAYLHERPATGYDGSFPGFTRGARALALKDVETASDAAFSGADEVRSRGAVAFLSVVAPEGRPVGATARVFLDLAVAEGSRDRLLELRGRLLLSPTGDGWRIFGYDLSLGSSPAKGGRP
jgi:hypothetical protein